VLAVTVQSNTFLSSVLDECLTLHLSHCKCGERNPDTNLLGYWVGLKAGVDA